MVSCLETAVTQPKHAVVGTESASIGVDRHKVQTWVPKVQTWVPKVQTWVPKVQTRVELLKNLSGPHFLWQLNSFPGQLAHFLVLVTILVTLFCFRWSQNYKVFSA